MCSVAGTLSQALAAEFLFQLTFRPSGVAQGDEQMAWPSAFAHGLQDVFGRGELYLVVDLQGRLPLTTRVVQHKTTIGLYRTTEMDGHVIQLGLFERHVDLCEQLAQGQADRPVHNDTHRTFVVMLTYVGERFRKEGIGHRWHGDQEMIGEVYAGHGGIVAL